ncbi:putative multidrug resistance ABC transporter [Venturia nashicola]|uniref:Putative multidrug resistance ABC transporter n=1 Tax=Venturia nashicola TaxID=86259 RepID=A0A4Z1P1D6_9PEZI|nr:putative multidrug resistance ABC transporter [Venturia nashicola]TLD21699.1 putative multidrug resistance ABC transporter [Venturia nashicola]
MSLLGGLGLLHNADATAARIGVSSTTGQRQPDHDDQLHNDHPLGLHRTSTSESSRIRKEPPSSPTTLNEKNEKAGYEDPQDKISGDASSTDEEDARRDNEVKQLARKFSGANSFHSELGDVNPFDAPEGSRLDPHSPGFSAKAWAKRAMEFHRSDPEAGPTRTAGIAYKNLNVYGFGTSTDYQKSVTNVLYGIGGLAKTLIGRGAQTRIDILRNFEGLVYSGELLVVLGPPGSGCTTLLKTISGEMSGLNVEDNAYINYQGISAEQMHKNFRGEAIYTAEVDVHFPQLTVGDTLTFASRARAPRRAPGGMPVNEWSAVMRDVIMAVFGISHTVNTVVGNDFIRGVSGGERKRVTIAEASLSGAPLQCWDNSTRGLDSANAIEFCKTLRISSQFSNTTACVAIYQAPQAAYDIFDKVAVLYEGRQIFFGRCDEAQTYFEELGFDCPPRQTTADFLTSMTSPAERVVRPGWETRVPRTPDEFARRWQDSPQRKALLKEIDEYDAKFPLGGPALEQFKNSRRAQQAKHQRVESPFTLSFQGQIRLCLWRGFRRLIGDPSLTLTQLFGNVIMALVLGSVFYNLPSNTDSFYRRGALLFFAVLMNAFGAALEILTLYAQRPIIEKQARYAFYHPSAEAVASMLTDLPYKLSNCLVFNLTLYFMTNLRREPGAFFFFIFTAFLTTLAMSMVFRTVASASRTLPGAMAPTAILILAIVLFTGFTIPIDYMLGWSRWINYIDPVAYCFESLMINEFHNRNFTCSAYVPSGPGYVNGGLSTICSAVGSTPGSGIVNGDAYIGSAFQYYASRKWRNLGIIFGYIIGVMFLYLFFAETVSAKKSKGEVLVFRRGHTPKGLLKPSSNDEEAGTVTTAGVLKSDKAQHAAEMIQKQTAVFSWRDVCYEIKIKDETRQILNHVDGWVKPGTLTALMGVSGAGKTTLLDVLATRTTMGVITGEMLVDGRQRDQSFQRKTGYVQQQDLHLSTTTVRESLNFSAILRQPAHIPRKEKLAYVDEVIKLLDMEDYADAVVGVPGEGLNVEQRKRLTIGVELAAKPELLLFLDEPTSGLDSQTSWAICDLMEKLTRSGQAILCTIHQPSAMLFQRFDRLLFLQRGGQTVYYGEVGENARVLTQYFERNGGHPCPKGANPAEWMLEVIGAAPGSHTDIDWFETWRNSPEYQETQLELDRLRDEAPHALQRTDTKAERQKFAEFAAPFSVQLAETQKRVFQQYWRTPSYIYSKIALCLGSALFIGFVFYKTPISQQGLQNQMFSIFMLFTIFGQLVQQIMPHFVTQRALYEVRERPAKTYSWKAFMLSNIFVELPWQTLMALIVFICWYYPIGMYKNAIPDDQVHERGALMFLYIWAFLVFASTFAHMAIAGVDTAEVGGNIANLAFSMSLIFCGVLASPRAFPRFWIWMYRISPFTYLVDGILATGLANTNVICAPNEYLNFQPARGTCGTYMAPYIARSGGYLANPNATRNCSYCAIGDTNVFLASVSSSYSHRWRNFGIMWAYITFNVIAALSLYWYARMPKGAKKADEKEKKAKA